MKKKNYKFNKKNVIFFKKKYVTLWIKIYEKSESKQGYI